jgi:hypothetical protein
MVAVAFIEEDTGWRRGWVVTSLLQVIVQLLDTRLMGERRE